MNSNSYIRGYMQAIILYTTFQRNSTSLPLNPSGVIEQFGGLDIGRLEIERSGRVFEQL